MAHIGLQRQLLYANASSDEVMLERDPINKELYKFWDGDYASLFDDHITKRRLANEVYYQLTRAYEEDTPQEGVYNNYYNDISYDLRTSYGTDVCVCSMWIVLELQESLPEKIVAFKSELENVVKDVFALESAKDFCRRMKKKGKRYNSDFTPRPVNPDKLSCRKEDDWALATEGFGKKKIRTIIYRYTRHENRIAVFRMIENAFPMFEQLANHPENKEHVNIYSGHRDRKFYFWFYFENADRADNTFFAELLEELEANSGQPMLFDPKDLKIAENHLLLAEQKAPKTQEEFNKWMQARMDAVALRQELSMREAKADMLAKENDQLRNRVAELEAKLKDKKATIADLKEQVHPHDDNNPDCLQELDDCFLFKNLVREALSSHDITYVDYLLKLMYRKTGSVVSAEKNRLIDLVEKWADELKANAHGIHIDNFYQTGGTSINELHNYLDQV